MFPSDFWFDKWKIHGGEDLFDKIANGVTESDVVVLFASKASLTSGWVEKEWETKLKEEIEDKVMRLIVAIIDETTPNELPVLLQNKYMVIMLRDGVEGPFLDSSIEKLAVSIARLASKLLLKRFRQDGSQDSHAKQPA